jgi:hypothetical protein
VAKAVHIICAGVLLLTLQSCASNVDDPPTVASLPATTAALERSPDPCEHYACSSVASNSASAPPVTRLAQAPQNKKKASTVPGKTTTELQLVTVPQPTNSWTRNARRLLCTDSCTWGDMAQQLRRKFYEVGLTTIKFIRVEGGFAALTQWECYDPNSAFAPLRRNSRWRCTHDDVACPALSFCHVGEKKLYRRAFVVVVTPVKVAADSNGGGSALSGHFILGREGDLPPDFAGEKVPEGVFLEALFLVYEKEKRRVDPDFRDVLDSSISVQQHLEGLRFLYNYP